MLFGHFWTIPSAILDPVSQRPKDGVFGSEKGLPRHPLLQDCGEGEGPPLSALPCARHPSTSSCFLLLTACEVEVIS